MDIERKTLAPERVEWPSMNWGPAVLAAALLFSMHWRPVFFYDEGYAAYGAWRMAHGAWPYRDFQLNYAPGSFCANAGAFFLFGDSLNVLRWLDGFLRLALTLAVFFSARRFGAGTGSWFAFALALLLNVSNHMPPGNAVVGGSLWLLFFLWAWQRHAENTRGGWDLKAGILLACTALFRQDLVVYGAGALVASTCWFNLRPGAGVRPGFRALLRCGAVAIVFTSILYFPFVLTTGISRLFAELVVIPARVASGPYVLELPSLTQAFSNIRVFLAGPDLSLMAIPATALAIFGGLGICLAGILCSVRQGLGMRQDRGLLLLSLTGLLTVRQGLNRADLTHCYPLLLLIFIILSLLWTRTRSSWLRPVMVLFAAFFLCLPLAQWFDYARRLPSLPRSGLDRARGLPLSLAYDQMVLNVKKATLPGQKVYFAWPPIYRRLTNDDLFYFLADRPCSSYYHLLIQPFAGSQEMALLKALQDGSTAAVLFFDPKGPWGEQEAEVALRTFGHPAVTRLEYLLLLRQSRTGP